MNCGCMLTFIGLVGSCLTTHPIYANPAIEWMRGGHTWDVTELKVARDGTKLVSVCAEGTLKLWSLPQGEFLRSFIAHTNIIRSMDLSPDGTKIASGADGGDLIVWDAQTGQILRRWVAQRSVGALSFSPDGTKLASGSGHSGDPTAKLWNLADASLIHTFVGHTSLVSSIFFTPDGQSLITSSFDRSIREWDVTTGELRNTTIPGRAIITAALSPDGNTYVYPGTNIVRYSLPDWSRLEPYGTSLRNIREIVFSPTGANIALGAVDATIRIWDSVRGTEVRSIAVPTHGQLGVESLAYSANGESLFSGGADWAIKEWDPTTGNLRRQITHFESGIGVCTASPDGSVAALGGGNALKLFRMSDGALLGSLPHSDVFSAAFSPDGAILVTGDYDNRVRLWNVSAASKIRDLTFHNDWLNDVAFAPNGQLIASASYNKTILLWNTNSSSPVRTLSGSTSSVEHVTFTPDGGTLLSGEREGMLRWWRVSDGKQTNALQAHPGWISDLPISRDGTLFATSCREFPNIKLWRISDATVEREIPTAFPVMATAFSPDGTMLAGALLSDVDFWTTGEIHIWRVSDGSLVQSFTNETKRAVRLDWTSKNRLVVGRADGVAIVFRMDNSETAPPELTGSLSASASILRLKISAAPNKTLRIQRSTNFSEWTEWTNTPSAGTEQTFEYPLRSGEAEFFRALID